LTIVGRNTARGARTVTGTLANLAEIGRLELYETDRFSANLERRPDVAVLSGSFSMTISPDSVFTLTTVAAGPPLRRP
jgi:hypothetical protein